MVVNKIECLVTLKAFLLITMVMQRNTNQSQEGLPRVNPAEASDLQESLPGATSAKHEQRVDRLIALMSEKFQQDDDAITITRKPWSRELFYNSQNHELLSAVAVLARVKPAALLNESAFCIPEVRVVISRLTQGAYASTIIEFGNVKSLVVGEPSRVLEIVDVLRTNEALLNKGQEIPEHNFRRLGAALGYSESAIEYFILRNSSPLLNKRK